VHSGNTIYELDTSTTPPRLFIDGNFTKEGRGNYSNSLTRDCELFIALSNLKEGIVLLMRIITEVYAFCKSASPKELLRRDLGL